MIKTVLFDLDGTLLPMDQKEFTDAYFGALTKKLSAHGYDARVFSETMWKGVAAMMKNDGTRTNEERFWEVFDGVFGEKSKADRRVFDEFYESEFDGVKASCGYNERASQAVREIKNLGYRLVLATNPSFPMTAQLKRLKWAGCDPDDFELITSFENSSACKPNPAYFTEILKKIECTPDECIMAGNDATEDTCAEKIGMRTFLLTECLINKDGKDISAYPHGGFDDLIKYIDSIAQ